MQHNQHDAAGPRGAALSYLSDWLEVQSLTNLARFAGRPAQQLREVLVTEAMKEAAMEYVYSLYDPLMSTHLLEEIFRIMIVLQSKAQADPQGPL